MKPPRRLVKEWLDRVKYYAASNFSNADQGLGVLERALEQSEGLLMDVHDGCSMRLASSYQRLLLKYFNTRRLPLDLTDDELRDQIRDMLVRSGGRGVSDAMMDTLVQQARMNERRYPDALRKTVADLGEYVSEISEHELAIGGSPILQGSCVGAFVSPTAAFNSTTIRTETGDYLILVNMSLLEMIWQSVKIFVLSTDLTNGMFSYLDHIKNSITAVSPAHALVKILGFYVGVPLTSRDLLEQPTGLDRRRADDLFQACLHFIVGHEYAHILAGHLESDVELHSGKSDVKDVNEVSADWLGVQLLLAEWRWGDFPDDEWSTRFQTRLGAPLFFFAIERLVTLAEQRLGIEERWSVAPPLVRRTWLEPFYRELAGGKNYQTAFPLAYDHENWIYRMKDELEREIETLDIPPGTSLRTWRPN